MSLAEVLIVIAITVALVATTTPVFIRAKARASETLCIGNLRTIGVTMTLYRMEQGLDGNYGHPLADMGLPPGGYIPSLEPLQCQGMDIGCQRRWGRYYTFYPPGIGFYDTEAEWETALSWWREYSSNFQSASVIMYDPRHQSVCPTSLADRKRAYKLLESGSVQLVIRTGRLPSVQFWHGSGNNGVD